jgi:hypothetical protein
LVKERSVKLERARRHLVGLDGELEELSHIALKDGLPCL